MYSGVFDLDGTVIDLFDLHLAGFQSIVKKDYGLEFTRGDLEATYGKTGEEIARIFFEKKGVEGVPIHEFAERRRQWVIDNMVDIHVIKGVRELLDGLLEEDFTLGVATSNTRNIGEAIIEASGLSDLFSASAFRDPSIRGKPAPDIFLMAANLLGADPADCVAFEDSIFGVQAAKTAGMKVVGTATGTHTYDELLREEPDRLVHDLTEISVEDVLGLL